MSFESEGEQNTHKNNLREERNKKEKEVYRDLVADLLQVSDWRFKCA